MALRQQRVLRAAPGWCPCPHLQVEGSRGRDMPAPPLSPTGGCGSPAARSRPGGDTRLPRCLWLHPQGRPCPWVLWWQRWLQGEWHICPSQFSLFLLLCQSCSARLTVWDPSHHRQLWNSGQRGHWWHRGAVGMSYLAWSPTTMGILPSSAPWEHPEGQWVSFTRSGGWRLPSQAPFSWATSLPKKAAPTPEKCSRPPWGLLLRAHPLLSWRSSPKTLTGTGPSTDPEGSGRSLVWGAEPRPCHALSLSVLLESSKSRINFVFLV